MSKVLMGAIVNPTKIAATFQITVLGETSVRTKDKEWSAETLSTAAAFVKLCDDLTPEIGDVIGVQIYTPITDPTDGGVLIDLLFKDNTSFRINNPPSDIATLRDTMKAAIVGDL